MSKLIMCKGLPGSGKSTWAADQVLRSQMSSDDVRQWVIRVNKDDIRTTLNKPWNQELEKHVLNVRDSLIREGLRNCRVVISDDTNLAPKHEKRLRQIAMEACAEFEVKSFLDVPMDVCIERDSKREGKARVGEKVIVDMAQKYLQDKYVVSDMVSYAPDHALPGAIIVDLDGTAAIHNGRGPYDFQRCDTDLVNEPVRDLVNAMYAYKGCEVIYLSGRDDIVKDKTRTWLEKGGFPSGKLYMRKTGDKRKDSLVKYELFDHHVRSLYKVYFVVDDRNQVVEMWRKIGLTCLQVADGNF